MPQLKPMEMDSAEVDSLDKEKATELAVLWVRRKDGDYAVDKAVEQSVVLMSFTASSAVQWAFICAAMNKAQSDEALGHLAAGPVERLLGRHGDEIIDRVEDEAERSPKFARMMTGVWRYTMSDTVWSRVEAIKASAIAAGNQL